MAKLDFKSDIFKTSHKSIFYNFFLFFFIYIYKNVLSAKYYQENKGKLQKKLMKYQNLPNKEKQKNDNMVVNITKIFQKMKKKLIEYRYYRMRKNALL